LVENKEKSHMKHLKIMPAVLIVLLAMAMPSISAAQYNESRLDNFLSQRPGLRAQLERNPNLIYNKEFRHQHPDLQEFMQNHPNVWGKLPGYGRWGAYGPDHNWHEADWWHEHDPGWMYSNHPEWVQDHADWRADRNNHPEWFGHPGAAVHHEESVHHERAVEGTHPQDHHHHE
jgi:hypothetical protein